MCFHQNREQTGAKSQMEPPKAFIFDVFGTVVDWRSGVAAEVAKCFAQQELKIDPWVFAERWREKYQPAMERIRSGNRGYLALDVLHRENLDALLAEFDIEVHFNESQREDLNRAWEKLPAWPKVVDDLHSLKKRAIIAPCSNGSIALMTRLAKFASLPWDCILGAEIARNYKPHRDAYLRSVAALGLEPQEVVMVAAHNDDLAAAQIYGLRTAFICRNTEHGKNQTEDLAPTGDWDYIIDSFDELLTL